MVVSEGAGFVLATVAAIANGTFLVPYKLRVVHALKVNPLVFQCYASIGIFLSSWVVVAFLPLNPDFVAGATSEFVFVPWAMLAGSAVVIAMTLSFLATQKIGVALAQGVFGGLAIVVSYIWGLCLFDESASDPTMSAFGVVLIVCGIAAIGGCKEISCWLGKHFPCLQTHCSESDERMGTNNAMNNDHTVDDDGELHSEDMNKQLVRASSPAIISPSVSILSEASFLSHIISREDFVEGVIYAILCGIAGGSSLVPIFYIPNEHRGFAMFPAFGFGAILTAPIILVVNRHIYGSSGSIINFDIALFAGIVAGAIWMVNCVLTIGAIPVLGYSVAFPLVHCSVFISGLWGMYAFREFHGQTLASIIFFASGVVLIAGAIMISVGK
jgi:glucose uptake protein GlcU